MRRAIHRVVLCAASLTLAPAGRAQLPVRSEHVVGGLDRPLLVLAPPGDRERLLVVEQGGRIDLLRGGTLLPTPFLDLSARVAPGGEQGLLGMAFDPSFPLDPRVYVAYTRSDGATIVESYTVGSEDPDRADPASAATVLGPVAQPSPTHNGGCLAFAHDGTLFVALGDGGHAFDQGPGHVPGGNAQSPATLLGKLLRLDVDLPFPHVPADNPFVGNPQVLDPIWASGLREPWRFSFDRATGDLWLGDVGQAESEEVDLVRYPAGSWGGTAKRNFGWRCREGALCTGLSGCLCDDAQLVEPVLAFDHSVGCAMIGGFVYRGCAIPSLRGWYVYASFCYGSSSRVFAVPADDPRGERTIELTAALGIGASGLESVTSFGEDSAGELYYCLLEGVVREIVHAGTTADCNGNGVADACDIAEGTSLDLDGNGRPDECDRRLAGPPQAAPKRDRP